MATKRIFDILFSLFALLIFGPFIILACVLVWFQDFRSPFYVAPRVGLNRKLFSMVKLRSMVINADKSGVDSTAANDQRITAVGRFVRRYKLDELTQFWNVLKGDMSLVGPRPNVKRETDLYTAVEQRLLTLRPGITDLASIVFSDEGDILKDSKDPDIDYNQLIRPWKNHLALLYVNSPSIGLDIRIAFLTAMAIVSREKALQGVQKILEELKASDELKSIASRQRPLIAAPPPGADKIVTSRS